MRPGRPLLREANTPSEENVTLASINAAALASKGLMKTMELIIIVALFLLTVALGLAGTRAILGVMFSVMMRARTAPDYAGSFERRATARAA